MADRALFTTFYSFKGGVGRTLALVSTAVWLTQQDHSVIIWDMDIEAPGVQNIPYFEPIRSMIQGGFVDIVADFRENKGRQLNTDRFSSYLVKHPQNSKLRLLAAGKLDDEDSYSHKFTAIEWEKLFGPGKTAGFRLFELIRREILSYHPDFVLVDSRTGFTDVGGVCCVQLPHVVFLVFNYGSQNLHGTRLVHTALTDTRRLREMRPDKDLKVYLAASMVPDVSVDLKKKRQEEWRAYDLRPHVEIPYNVEVALGEAVWTAEHPEDRYCEVFAGIGRILIDERDSLLPASARAGEGPGIGPRFRVPGREAELFLDKAREFERKTGDLFRLMGFEVERDKYLNGSQVDLFLTLRSQIETRCYLVECKDWERNIGKETVDEVENNLKSARKAYPACLAILVGRKGFTKEARDYAQSLQINLKTYDELLNGIVNFERYLAYLKTIYAGTELERSYIEQDVIIEDTGRAQAVLDYVASWLKKPRGGFFTLLGDFGTGKTSFTQRLAHDLAMAYGRTTSDSRIPVLIDLKNARRALSLENILFDHFSRTAQMSVNPETILHLLREGKLLLIFDGFDEMATQTSAALTMQNFQELNRAFSGSARVIITCRTHYFKDRAQTEETLKAKKQGLSEYSTELYRAIKGREGYTIGYLQEFRESQVRDYLRKSLPEAWEEAWDTIQRVYNLRDLSSRPVLLDMIVKSLPKIRARGQRILAADLYGAYVQTWLDRDDWRLELTNEGRELLVEEIAERLWEQDSDRLHFTFLGDVLKEYLKDQRRTVTSHDIELASSEVRTASFLTRDDDGNYGFAHRSFLEYFLARRIARCLKSNDTRCLSLRPLSKEVVLFLSQMIHPDLLMRTAHEVLGAPYRKRISENALHIFYWCVRYRHSPDGKIRNGQELGDLFRKLRPLECRLEEAQLDRAELAHVSLEGAKLDRAQLDSAILTGAVLTRASLRDAAFSFADMVEADLSRADLTSAVAGHVNLKGATLTGANLTEANLYAANLMSADLEAVKLDRADLSRAGLLRAKLPEALPADAALFGCGSLSKSITQLVPLIECGHSESVTSVHFSPDGKILASGSDDGTIRLWDVGTGKEIASLSGHSESVTSVSFSPDGKILASGSIDGTVRLWDVATGKEIGSLSGHSGFVSSVNFSPDGKILASGSYDRTIRLWDVATGKEIASLSGHSGFVFSINFSPDGKILASGSDDRTIRLWDVATGKEIASLSGHSESATSVNFSPDGKILASGSYDRTIRLWDVATGKEIASLSGHSESVTSVSFSPDGKILASGSWDRTIRLWDVATGKEIASLTGHFAPVFSINFSSDGKILASGSWDRTIRLWDVATEDGIASLSGHSGFVFSVNFSPDGKILASGSYDRTIRLWDVATGKEIASLSGHSGFVFSVSFSPDGKILASGSWDRTIRLWDVATGKEIASLSGHSESVTSINFSPDGKILASGSWDSTIRLWDVATGKEIASLSGHSGSVTSVSFSPDGKILASGSDDSTLRLWDVATGKEIASLTGHSGVVFSINFSPDGKILASGSYDSTIKLWDMATGKEIASLSGHSGFVTSVHFSPDGKILASGSNDRTIRLWDVATGKEIARLSVWLRSGLTLDFSAEFDRLACGDSEKALVLRIVSQRGKTTALEPTMWLHHLPDGEWAALDPQNHFVCSPGGRQYLAFRDNLALYPASDLPELECTEGLPPSFEGLPRKTRKRDAK